MSAYKVTSKDLLYEEPGLKLEVLYIRVGDCFCRVFRELQWSATHIELKEYHILPDWWLRHIKIDKVLSYEKLYYQNNKTRMNAYAKEWKKTNKEKWNEYQREYKKRKLRETKELVRDYNRSVSRNDADKN